MARGLRSLADAIEAGVSIEEKGMDDLNQAMSPTDNNDLVGIYGNLTNGSRNHLAAFSGSTGQRMMGRRQWIDQQMNEPFV